MLPALGTPLWVMPARIGVMLILSLTLSSHFSFLPTTISQSLRVVVAVVMSTLPVFELVHRMWAAFLSFVAACYV